MKINISGLKKSGEIYFFEGNLIQGGRQITDVSPQGIGCPRPQDSDNCASFAVMNLFEFVKANHLYPSEKTRKKLEDDAYMDTLYETVIEKYIGSYGYDQLLSGAGFWERLSTPSQAELMVELFKGLDFKVKNTHSTFSLKNHLKKGLPAILTLVVDRSSNFLIDLRDSRYDRVQRYSPTSFFNSAGESHAVVALGYIPGVAKDHIIVYDSGYGRLDVWPALQHRAFLYWLCSCIALKKEFKQSSRA